MTNKNKKEKIEEDLKIDLVLQSRHEQATVIKTRRHEKEAKSKISINNLALETKYYVDYFSLNNRLILMSLDSIFLIRPKVIK